MWNDKIQLKSQNLLPSNVDYPILNIENCKVLSQTSTPRNTSQISLSSKIPEEKNVECSEFVLFQNQGIKYYSILCHSSILYIYKANNDQIIFVNQVNLIEEIASPPVKNCRHPIFIPETSLLFVTCLHGKNKNCYVTAVFNFLNMVVGDIKSRINLFVDSVTICEDNFLIEDDQFPQISFLNIFKDGFLIKGVDSPSR